MEMRILIGKNIGFDVTERRLRPVLDTVVEGLEDIFLEVRWAWMRRNYGAALSVGELLVVDFENVHFHARGDKGDDRMHVRGDSGSRVQRDSCPDEIEIGLRDGARPQEVAGGVGAIDLETFVVAEILRGEPHIVEHGAGVEQLAIENEATSRSRKHSEMVDSAGMIEQQLGFGIANEFPDLLA